MWWIELEHQAEQLDGLASFIHSDAEIEPGAVIRGAVSIGAGTRVCHGAFIQGPVEIGENCLIGNNCVIRGSTRIGDGTRIGFASELKNALIGQNVAIGPQCFVADSKVEDDAYLGAQVRTSNHRLDRETVSVLLDGHSVDTGLEKLGCLIGRGTALGIQVVVLPGRIVPPDSLFAPRITVTKNLPAGRYRIKQTLESF